MTRTTETPENPNLSSMEMDSLGRTQAELLSELWILRDRVLVMEHLLAEAGILKQGQIDNFAPPPELTSELDADRDSLVARVIGAGHRQRISVDELKATAHPSKSSYG
jgi:hypothetical protein